MKSDKHISRSGMTLVEVLLAIVLVSAAAMAVYQGGLLSYKMMMRSRLRLEAQGLAFDALWRLFNSPYATLATRAGLDPEISTPPAGGVFPQDGIIRSAVIPATNLTAGLPDYYEIQVQVFAPSNSPLFSVLNADGTIRTRYPNPLADYRVLRYPGDR